MQNGPLRGHEPWTEGSGYPDWEAWVEASIVIDRFDTYDNVCICASKIGAIRVHINDLRSSDTIRIGYVETRTLISAHGGQISSACLRSFSDRCKSGRLRVSKSAIDWIVREAVACVDGVRHSGQVLLFAFCIQSLRQL